jgi:hypothetical protein
VPAHVHILHTLGRTSMDFLSCHGQRVLQVKSAESDALPCTYRIARENNRSPMGDTFNLYIEGGFSVYP